VGFGLLVTVGPAIAHHSIAAEFDRTKTIEFTGVVKKVDWMNPHIYTHVEAKDETGKVVVWQVEGGAPNALFRNGWRPDTLKVGETVKFSGSRAKNPTSPRVNGTLTRADGSRAFAGGGPAR
jgi:hypothetical protein